MNPKPSLYQCLVLHEMADGDVRWHEGEWYSWINSRHIRVTSQVEKLAELGCITLSPEGALGITAAGVDVLRRRPRFELVEAINRKS